MKQRKAGSELKAGSDFRVSKAVTGRRAASGVVLLLALLLAAGIATIGAGSIVAGVEKKQRRIETAVGAVEFLQQSWGYAYTVSLREVLALDSIFGRSDPSMLEELRPRFNARMRGFARGRLSLDSLGYSDSGLMENANCLAQRGTECWGAWMGSLENRVYMFVHYSSVGALRPVFRALRLSAAAERVNVCAVTPQELRQGIHYDADIEFGHYQEPHQPEKWDFLQFGDPVLTEVAEISRVKGQVTCDSDRAAEDGRRIFDSDSTNDPGSVLLLAYELQIQTDAPSVQITGAGEIDLGERQLILGKVSADKLTFQTVGTPAPEVAAYRGVTTEEHGRDVVRVRRRNDPIEPEDPRQAAASEEVYFSHLDRSGVRPVRVRDTEPTHFPANIEAKQSCYSNAWPERQPGVVGRLRSNRRPSPCVGLDAGSPHYQLSSLSSYARDISAISRPGQHIKWRYVIPARNRNLHDPESGKKVGDLTAGDLNPGWVIEQRGGEKFVWPTSSLSYTRPATGTSPAAPGAYAAAVPSVRLSNQPDFSGFRAGARTNIIKFILTYTGSHYIEPSITFQDRKGSNGWGASYSLSHLHLPAIHEPIRSWNYRPNAGGTQWGWGEDGRILLTDWRAHFPAYYQNSSLLLTTSVARHITHQLFAPGVRRRPQIINGYGIGSRTARFRASRRIYRDRDGDGVHEGDDDVHGELTGFAMAAKLRDNPTTTLDHGDVSKIVGGASAAKMKIHRLYGAIHLRPDFMRYYHADHPRRGDYYWDWNGRCDTYNTNTGLSYNPFNPNPRLLAIRRRFSGTELAEARGVDGAGVAQTPASRKVHPDCPTHLHLWQSAAVFSEALIFNERTGTDGGIRVAMRPDTERLNELWPAEFERTGVASLQAIRPYRYRTEFPGSTFSSGQDIGFLAQEIQAYYPGAVQRHKDILSIGYYSLLPALWSHLQDARARHNRGLERLDAYISSIRQQLEELGRPPAGAGCDAAEGDAVGEVSCH